MARPIMGLFTDHPEVIRLGADHLNVQGFVLPVHLALFALNPLPQALKRPGATARIGLHSQAFAVAFFTGSSSRWSVSKHGASGSASPS